MFTTSEGKAFTKSLFPKLSFRGKREHCTIEAADLPQRENKSYQPIKMFLLMGPAKVQTAFAERAYRRLEWLGN